MNTTPPEDPIDLPPINLPVPDSAEPIQTPTIRQTLRALWRDMVAEDKPTDLMVGIGVLLGIIFAIGVIAQAIKAGVPHTITLLFHPTQATITHYLDTHAGTVGVPAATLAVAWLIVGGLLWLTGTALAARGAQLGWLLYGVASAAMAYTGAAHPAAWTAAGITGAWWALLSIPALRRQNRPTSFEAVVERHQTTTE